MLVLLKLLLAHLLGDFLLQPKKWVALKEKNKAAAPQLYFHALIHGLLVLLFLGSLKYWGVALIICISHGIIDVVKLYGQTPKSRTGWFLFDQLLHLIVIAIVWISFFQPEINTQFIYNDAFWIYTTAIYFLTLPVSILLYIVLNKWAPQLGATGDDSLMNAGKYIGMLERLFVFLFVVSGNWQAIGFLLAAKSVFRFGDLRQSKDRKLTEYILIGTLMSFGMAIITALLVLKLTPVSQ